MIYARGCTCFEINPCFQIMGVNATHVRSIICHWLFHFDELVEQHISEIILWQSVGLEVIMCVIA